MRRLISLSALAILAACDTPAHIAALGEPELVQVHASAPPGAAPGSCWGRDVTPAIIETVSEKIMMQPAEVHEDGTVITEPVYKLETRRAIVRARKELWFETPCQDQLTPDFIASLQRALKARGFFNGSINGEVDARTRHAVRRFQKPQGLDSSILSLAATRKLGLAAVKHDE